MSEAKVNIPALLGQLRSETQLGHFERIGITSTAAHVIEHYEAQLAEKEKELAELKGYSATHKTTWDLMSANAELRRQLEEANFELTNWQRRSTYPENVGWELAQEAERRAARYRTALEKILYEFRYGPQESWSDYAEAVATIIGEALADTPVSPQEAVPDA